MKKNYILSVDSFQDVFTRVDSLHSFTFSIESQNEKDITSSLKQDDYVFLYRRAPISGINVVLRVDLKGSELVFTKIIETNNLVKFKNNEYENLYLYEIENQTADRILNQLVQPFMADMDEDDFLYKNLFTKWLKVQVKPEGDSDAGNPYSESTISMYIKFIEECVVDQKPLFSSLELLTINKALNEENIKEDRNSRKISAIKKYREFAKIFNDEKLQINGVSPEWFAEKAINFPTLDTEGNAFLQKFSEKYSVEKISNLEGIELLNTIFLNPNNKSNLCYILEFDKDCRDIFGSIKSGTAYKYGLHYSQKNNTWATGSGRKPQFLSEEEAIELGTQIRDYLVAGAEVIDDFGEISSVADYQKLFHELEDVTDGYINRVWFVKYYALLHPEIFPPIYSTNAQNTVLEKLGIEAEKNLIARIGQIREFVDKCGISNIMFSRIFWTYCNSDDDRSEEEFEEVDEVQLPYIEPVYHTGIKIVNPETTKPYAHNRIVFGAPGTGKSFKLDGEQKDLIKDGGEVERVTFHPDYSYAHFVGTYKPVPSAIGISYEYVPGPFMRTYVNAIKNGRSENTEDVKPYLLLIEEINRANVAAVFGEVFQLLDRDGENKSQYSVKPTEDIKAYLAKKLGGVADDYRELIIPDNMYIWSTMNSADQGVFPMDTAFKRRWDFEYIGINHNDSKIDDAYLVCEKAGYKVNWNQLRKAINDTLSSNAFKINEDKLMGPFFVSKSVLDDAENFREVFKSKVIMYLFEDAAKQRRSLLFEGCDENTRTKYSSICEDFDKRGIEIFCKDVRDKVEIVRLNDDKSEGTDSE